MKFWTRICLCGLLSMLGLVWASGCAHNERRTVRVEEEQRQGDVHEESQGEMIVE